MVSCSDPASTRLEALFVVLFVLAALGMIASLGLNAFLVYFKIIKKRIHKQVIPVHEVRKFVYIIQHVPVSYYASCMVNNKKNSRILCHSSACKTLWGEY